MPQGSHADDSRGRGNPGPPFPELSVDYQEFTAYLEDGLWLALARHSNGMADRLRAGLRAAPSAREAWDTRTNEVFAILDKGVAERARAAGAVFYDWNPPHGSPSLVDANEVLVRLVTSWSTRESDVTRFAAAIA